MTGDHLSFEGNCGVRAQPTNATGSGRSNGVMPSLASDFLCCTPCCPSVSKPHATSWPQHVRRTFLTSGEALNKRWPHPLSHAYYLTTADACRRAEQDLHFPWPHSFALALGGNVSVFVYSVFDLRNVSRRHQGCLALRT